MLDSRCISFQKILRCAHTYRPHTYILVDSKHPVFLFLLCHIDVFWMFLLLNKSHRHYIVVKLKILPYWYLSHLVYCLIGLHNAITISYTASLSNKFLSTVLFTLSVSWQCRHHHVRQIHLTWYLPDWALHQASEAEAYEWFGSTSCDYQLIFICPSAEICQTCWTEKGLSPSCKRRCS